MQDAYIYDAARGTAFVTTWAAFYLLIRPMICWATL